ncbi:hypothetical protein, partial [Sedimentitalea nanhaiensis]|uniref:UrcA family protein n=1 Tax=Sedimentitalea nanhaiensis TaxID=999627 RepID=A0A1I7EAP9_9RHOB
MPRLLTAVLILLLAAAPPVLAQGYGGLSSGLNNRTTNKVVRMLEKGLRQCQALDAAYRYDCYRQNYRDAAQQLDNNPAYAPAQKALRDVETTLQSVLRNDTDPATGSIRRRGRTFTAIQESAVPRSKAAFSAALDEARTRLLRSSSNPGDHFSRIASVLNSNKVFLRS